MFTVSIGFVYPWHRVKGCKPFTIAIRYSIWKSFRKIKVEHFEPALLKP